MVFSIIEVQYLTMRMLFTELRMFFRLKNLELLFLFLLFTY